MIIIVDRVHDLSLFELLQRLRKTQGGGALPIAVMTDQLYPRDTACCSDARCLCRCTFQGPGSNATSRQTDDGQSGYPADIA